MTNKWIEPALAGNRRAVARLISLVEMGVDSAETIIKAIYSHTGKAHIIGITGSPGCGKSTLVNQLAKAYRQANKRVGIVAIDPSSPFTGGAILGDRIRMKDLSGDTGIFIRSMATRGSLGGLARAAADAVKVLDAAGYDIILIETVGAGQSEVDIANAAHTTLVVEAPGMGDDIQTIKAGILEIADILVVNKADRPGAGRTVKSLRSMLRLGHSTRVSHHGQTIEIDATTPVADAPYWHPKLRQTVAIRGEGIDELVETIDEHHTFLKESGGWFAREMDRCGAEVEQLLLHQFLRGMKISVSAETRSQLIKSVAERHTTPHAAAHTLLAEIHSEI